MKIIEGNSGKSPILRGILLQLNRRGVLVFDELNIKHMFGNFPYIESKSLLDSQSVINNMLSANDFDDFQHFVFLTKHKNLDSIMIRVILDLEQRSGKQFYMQVHNEELDHIKIYDMK